MIPNYTWFLTSDLVEHEGKWVAIMNEQVVASSHHLKVLMDEIKSKYSFEKVSLVKVPSSKEALVYHIRSSNAQFQI